MLNKIKTGQEQGTEFWREKLNEFTILLSLITKAIL